MDTPPWGEPRSREITWHDPIPPLATLAVTSGLDYLRAVGAGTVPPPPVAMLLGMTLGAVDEGEAVFALEPHESHFNPLGVVHGGVLCTVLDTVAGCAVHTTLAAGWGYTTIDINVSFLRPVTLDTGRVTFTGRVLKRGRRISYSTAEARDGAGVLLASATSSLLVMEPPPAQAEPGAT